jgi:hypothetical protein
MKYIFVAGAPGSKWSSVVKNIYYSPDIDRSDYRDEWTYYHDASGKLELMHLGAYFDPGMESDLPENFNELTREELEKIFDTPFTDHNTGIRIIKSHIFANHIDFIRATWPDAPIVLVHRGDDACLGWWVKCGHFDITYPLYHSYYKNLKEMARIIQQQNQGITDAIWDYKPNLSTPANNYELCEILGLQQPPTEYRQNYASSDITVKVIV